MLDNIVIAYSLTKVGRNLNITQTEDFATRGLNYFLKPDGDIDKFTKGHSKYFYEEIYNLNFKYFFINLCNIEKIIVISLNFKNYKQQLKKWINIICYLSKLMCMRHLLITIKNTVSFC